MRFRFKGWFDLVLTFEFCFCFALLNLVTELVWWNTVKWKRKKWIIDLYYQKVALTFSHHVDGGQQRGDGHNQGLGEVGEVPQNFSLPVLPRGKNSITLNMVYKKHLKYLSLYFFPQIWLVLGAY